MGGQQLRLVLHLTRTETGAFQAALDSVDQGAMGLKVDKVVVEGNRLRLELPAIGAEFRGEWRESQGEIQGFWRQSGLTLPLTFRRTATAQALSRRQEPQPPFPYRQEEVKIRNDKDGTYLAGTLTRPPAQGAKSPAVLLVSGSGPQDRDGTVAGHRPFLVLADYLTRLGFVVLRTDDRGVGASEGHWMNASLEDLATDAQACVAFLKARQEVDPDRVVLLGHSLGGIVASLAARETSVAGVVLLAVPAVPGEALLHLQFERLLEAAGAGKKDIAKAREINSQVYAIVAKAEDQQAAAEEIRGILRQRAGMSSEAIEAQVRMVLSLSFRSFLFFDPKLVFPHLKMPVLALYGKKDLQVPAAENAAALQRLFPKSDSAKLEVQILSGLNHLFQECRKGTPEEYAAIEQTMSPKALHVIATWLAKTLVLPKP